MSENLARLLIERSTERPDLKIGVHGDAVDLADAVAFASAFARDRILSRVEPRARVALIGTTSTDYLITWMACILASTPVALINPTYPEHLLGEMLEDFDPVAVIGDPAQLAATGWQGPVIEAGDARRRKDGAAADLPGVEAGPLEPASFMHTSGTTGLPKFCVQTHSYFLRLGADVAATLGLTASDRVFAPLPMFHINPMGYGVLGALVAGADVLGAEKFSASAFWEIVADEGITALILHSPPVAILNRRDPSEFRKHRVKTMFYADRAFMRRFGIPKAVTGYGSTEAGGLSHMRVWSSADDIPDDASRHGGSPRHGIEWKLDQDGQIALRADSAGILFDGYFARGELRAPFEDGWFATGDYGRIDDDGLVFVERASESIRVKGEFVPIQFVEDEIARVEGIHDLALWKRTGELVDDDVVLYVVGPEIPVAALRVAADALPGFMRPSVVIRTAKLPRDAAAGKVQRRLLAEQTILEEISL